MLKSNHLTPRRYGFPDGGQEVLLIVAVLETFSGHRQFGRAPEAGGLLFAEFALPEIRIVEATPPNSTDKRSRTSFVPDRGAQGQIIRDRFERGLHLVGEWHTHPERTPKPSQWDYQLMSSSFEQSIHELDSLLMVIVGNAPDALHLWVSAHNSYEICLLHEVQERTSSSPSGQHK